MADKKRVIIIGSGPAGISAALYTARGGLDTCIVTAGLGSLDKAHMIQNYYGTGEISGHELHQKGEESARELGVRFVNEEVVGLTFESSLVVETAKSKLEADYVVIATGTSRRVPGKINISEYEGKGVSYCAVCDAFFYRRKNVAVLGNGEFALHEINDLLKIAASVTLLTNGEEVLTELPDGVILDKRKIVKLNGDDNLKSISFETGDDIEISGLFIALGIAGSTALAKKIGAATDGNNIKVNENMETTVPHLYAAGDCTGGLLQVAKAVYEGAVAGNHIVRAK